MMEKYYDKAEICNITDLTEAIDEALDAVDCPIKARMQMDIAIDELYSNIVKFAYEGKTGPAKVLLELCGDPSGVSLTFIDEGIPYNPLEQEDPDITLSADKRGVGGLGIFMVKNTMDSMEYERKDGKNVLRIYKHF